MAQYEYRVIAAPTRGVKSKGIKTPEDRFSHALEKKINELAKQGWEYQRAETLPSEERSGLMSTATNWRNVLVFRRDVVVQNSQPVLAEPSDPMLTTRQEPALAPSKPLRIDVPESETKPPVLLVDEHHDPNDMTPANKQISPSEIPEKTDV